MTFHRTSTVSFLQPSVTAALAELELELSGWAPWQPDLLQNGQGQSIFILISIEILRADSGAFWREFHSELQIEAIFRDA
jgi:hypothetical protein